MKAFRVKSIKLRPIFGLIVLLINFFFVHFSSSQALATVENCAVTTNTTAITQATTTNLVFTITNNDASSYNWIKITRPNFRFTINSGDSDNWDNAPASSAITFSSGQIAADGTSYFTVNVTTIDSAANAANWIVQVSDDGGSTIGSCTGTTAVSIISGSNEPVQLANLNALNITSTTASVYWTSTVDSISEINYGTTTEYGSSSSISTPNTFHSYSLVGLTPSTTYYFEAYVEDSNSNIDYEVSQFTTSAAAGGGSSAPVITNISAGTITSSSVTITWTTDIAATSVVNYGTTSGYGSTSSDSTYSTSHTATLTGLTANTTYHYQVVSTSAAPLTTTSSDNTFTTAVATVTATPTPTPTSTPTPTPTTSASSSTTTPTSTPTPTPTPTTSASSSTSTPTPTPTPAFITTPDGKIIPVIPQDTTPPTITLIANVTKPYITAPKMSVNATDDKQVQRVEFSIDGGQNWLPVEGNTFTPQVKEDGNYNIKARAIDTSGNIGISEEKTLVIDRLPPRVGGNILSLGSQVVTPLADGSILMLSGFDQKITMSSVGGATTVDLITDTTTSKQMFSLVKTPQTGLWSGALSFTSPGRHKLNVRSIDGAGHKIERNINDVIVLPSGKVLDKKGAPIQDATATLYYQNPASKLWTKWNASAFKQENPQITDSKGDYHFYVPPGKYYMRIDAKGSRPIATDIFTTEISTPINTTFNLNSSPKIKIGSFEIVFPDLFNDTATVNTNFEQSIKIDKKPTLVGRKISKFILPYSTGGNFDSKSILGKKNVMTFISSWSPSSLDQVGILDKLIAQKRLNGVIVAVGENKTKVSLFQKRGKYNTPIVVDSEVELANLYSINTMPSHYFIDEKGVIKKILYGVLSEEEFLREWKSY
ncbi:MAG: redoxin domain-containing protein [Candidatus Saccharibacteria bacterium]|nr:redoxin domain-containing protein [Candidatus Saccharibacteria bacterium]